MRVIVNRCLVGLVALALAGRARPADGPMIDPTWLAKARTEIKVVIEKYDKVSSRLEESSEIRSEKVPGSSGTIPFRPHTRRERVVRLDDNVIFERVRIDDDKPNSPKIVLECENSDYHFKLGKLGEKAAFAYLGSTLGKPKHPALGQQGGVYLAVRWYLGEALGAVENDGKHTLRALRFDETSGTLRIDYRHATDPPADTQLLVDPSHGWRLLERRVETPSLVGTERWSYGTTIGGMEFPTGAKNLTTYKVAKAPPNLEITSKVTSIKLTDKTPADFRLSAFGFPEPMGAPPPPRPTRWYIWISLAAGGCAALALGFAYLRRRSQGRLASGAVPGAKP
jgi:hypothetical protein